MQDKASLNPALKKRIKYLAHPLESGAADLDPRLTSISPIKAVLFDVYGTMLTADTGESAAESQQTRGNRVILETFEQLDIETDFKSLDNDLFNRFRQAIQLRRKELRETGNPEPEVNIINIWRRVFEQWEAEERIKGKPSENESLLRKFGVEFELRFNPCWPMPNLSETLNFLREREYVMGIISNSQFYTPLSIEALLDKSLKDLGFSSSLLYWSYEHGIAKPAVGFYEPVVEQLNNRFGIKSGEALYIGNDMLNDIYPARELGFKTALFAGDQRSLRLHRDDERVSDLIPDLILTDFSQLAECL